jgi:hypothetical protein
LSITSDKIGVKFSIAGLLLILLFFEDDTTYSAMRINLIAKIAEQLGRKWGRVHYRRVYRVCGSPGLVIGSLGHAVTESRISSGRVCGVVGVWGCG